MDSTTQFVSIAVILLAFAANVILTQIIRRRRRSVPLRLIPAYDTVPLMVGEAVEADRPLHLSFGSSGLGGTNTVLTLVSAELFYQVVGRAATGTQTPIITMSDPTSIPLAHDTLRRAYAMRGRLDRRERGQVRWYPSGGQSLAFAAALTATLGDDRVSGNILAGSFGPELALILNAANRRGQATIATSDQVEGQAVAYALSERALLGEELFTAGAYLNGSASQQALVSTIDIFRWLLILAILIPTILALYSVLVEGR